MSKTSEAFPFAGEGLFATRDIPEDTTFVSYNGFTMTSDQFLTKTKQNIQEWLK